MVFEQVGDGWQTTCTPRAATTTCGPKTTPTTTTRPNGGTGHDVLHVNDGDALDGAVGAGLRHMRGGRHDRSGRYL